jgi:signal transduction protein with GAF and PtsI domain
MKTSWTAYSVDSRTPSIATLPKQLARETHLASDIALLGRIANRMSSSAPLDEMLGETVELLADAVECDACAVYVADGEDLVLRASKNLQPATVGRLKLKSAQGIMGWTAEHREPVIVARGAHADPRFRLFNEASEETFEQFVSVPMVSGGRLAGVINVRSRSDRSFDARELTFIETLGFLAGAAVERARLETENTRLLDRLETRKVVERAKGILQREMQLSEEDAYLTLQRESRQRRKSMREVAEAIILSEDLKKKK